MFSIVIPLYEKAHQVSTTLASVRAQSFPDFELIIVDDGSRDDSVGVVREYLRQHPDLAARSHLILQSHAGVSAARNKGIHESKFDWIAFLDADDTWSPDYLLTQARLAKKYPSADVLAVAYGFYLGNGQYRPAKFSRLPFEGPDGLLDNYFDVAARSNPPLSSISTIVKKKSLITIGGFPEGVSSGEDLLTWARLALICNIAFNKMQLAVFNQDPANFNHDQKTRMPAENDLVGENLKAMLHSHPSISGLRQYVGLWYKMRAHIYISYAMRREAWIEWKKLFRFKPADYKTWAYLLFLVLPVKILS
jgi:glycosyltransferase involved in cell wall biosynthesis